MLYGTDMGMWAKRGEATWACPCKALGARALSPMIIYYLTQDVGDI